MAPELAFGLVLAIWVGSAVLMAMMYIGTSDAGAGVLVRAALRDSAASMWIVPGVLLIRTGDPLAVGAGVLLVANSARLLASRRPPKIRSKRTRFRRMSLFRMLDPSPGRASILAAIAFQAGIAAIAAGWSVSGGFLCAAAVAICVTRAIGARAYRPRIRPSTWKTLAAVLSTLLLAVAIAAMQSSFFEPGPVAGEQHPSLSAKSKSGTAPPAWVKLAGNDLLPGVILRPAVKRGATARIWPKHSVTTVAGLPESEPLRVPFTGEYRLFPTMSGGVQPDSAVYRGTPNDAVYASVFGGSVETEAYQSLNPVLDLTRCSKIQVSVVSGETTPTAASMQLVLADGTTQPLGSDFFGLTPNSEATLEFVVPVTRGRLVARALRIAFERDPKHLSYSTKVAVVGFTFIPKAG
jgi:hypothetical protein